MPSDLNHRAATLLEFWFAPETLLDPDERRYVWFNATPEFDAALATHFRADYDRAASGVYELWRDEPQTCLALVLLLDQLPRNLFRNSPRAYATDATALEVAREAITRGYDRTATPLRRCFFYLPFQHSENLVDQEMGVRLNDSVPEHPDKEQFAAAARHHHDVIAQFGRFPHRNSILGRPSTPEELDFLRQSGRAL